MVGASGMDTSTCPSSGQFVGQRGGGGGHTEAEFLDVIGTKVSLLFTVTSTISNCPPPPPSSKSGLKLVCNVNIVQYMETSCLRFLKLMPRNLNEIVRS
jgi:hypothetical protein